jgi:integrase
MRTTAERQTVWSKTSVQFLYTHRNGRYYVRTFAGGKEKWTSLKTKLLVIAKNRMKEHVDAAQKQQQTGNTADVEGRMTFGKAMEAYREELSASDIQPNTKAYREAGLKLVLRSWDGIENLNVRRISSKMVVDWFRKFKAEAKPHVPHNAKSPVKNSTGASITTLKCALDAVRQVLDVAVSAGHLYANPARNPVVSDSCRRMFKAARRERAERGPMRLPSREQFVKLVESIRNAGVSDCRACADFVELIAYCGARKNEANHLKWEAIDFGSEKIFLGTTKNGDGRHVPMTDEMRLLLEKLRNQRGEVNGTDRVLLVKEAQGSIDTACEKIGVARFTTHALRHLFGTACLEAGVDVRTVAEWMGHKDKGALLLKTYTHVRQQHETEMIRKVRFAPLPVQAAAA